MNKLGGWGKWFFAIVVLLSVYFIMNNNSNSQQNQENKLTSQAVIEDLNSLGTGESSEELETGSKQQEIEGKEEESEEEKFNEQGNSLPELQEKQCVSQFSNRTKCQGNAVMKEYQKSNCEVIWALWDECDYLCEEGECAETICVPETLDCNGNYIKKCKYDGSDWDNYYKYCLAGCKDGRCEPTCTSGYLDETRQVGDDIEIKYQHSDCSYDWIYWFACDGEWVEGTCVYEGPTLVYNITPIKNDSDTTCEQKYLDEYQCSGDWSERRLQYSDCSFVWVLWDGCEYGCGTDGKCNQQSGEINNAYVSSVIDGDTIKLDNGETVRLLGINAPEQGEKCYDEAVGHIRDLVEGKEVMLESDVGNRDQYGRLLRHVFIAGIHVNINMVEQGKAIAYIIEPNTKYEAELIEAEREAKSHEMCVWGLKNMPCSGCVKIAYFHYKAEGNDCYNLNDEYVIFQNNCPYTCDVTGWTVKDKTSRPAFVFPNREFWGGEQFTLYTGCGSNTGNQFYWCSSGYTCNAVWNNDGDTLYMRDNGGNLILSYTY